ncbi:MAG: hypothetical protein J6A54_04840 [Clostridia bacterium]|nr:hypothetical protein [Clostridia bacterium]
MLTVLPIQSKATQKELCELCGIKFDESSFAYRADDGEFLGVCQFSFSNDCGIINGFRTAPNTNDEEAMIIMLRASMNFMHRCGLKKSTILSNATTERFFELSGYTKADNGAYVIDLDKFYISPCHYKKS